jgi:hypothetical protein
MEAINEIERALEEGTVRDKHYLASWEWIQIHHTVIRVSHRRKQWRIDPAPLIWSILKNLEKIPGDRLEIARINLYAFAEALNDFTTDSALDVTEFVRLVDRSHSNGILTQME